MPELPEEARQRLLSTGLSERDVDFLMTIDVGREVGFDGQLGRGFISYFDDVAKDRDPKTAINWSVAVRYISSWPLLKPLWTSCCKKGDFQGQYHFGRPIAGAY